jgi:hypothetical protein
MEGDTRSLRPTMAASLTYAAFVPLSLTVVWVIQFVSPPEKAVIGLKYVYIAARGKQSVNGTWDIVIRLE